MMVDFPAPLGPRIAVTRPALMAKSTPRSTWSRPYRLVSPDADTTVTGSG